MKKQSNPLKSINLLLIPLALFGLVQLFTFSYNKEEEDNLHQSKMEEDYQIFSLSPPAEIQFAGAKVPLNEPEVYERLDREIHSNTYFHSNTILYFKKANRWFPVIEPILKENGVPDDFKYLALIESGLQNIVSPSGAAGYWQFMAATGKEYGLEINGEVDERYHIEKATKAACEYLKDSYELYGDWALVAASYNAGKGRISNELDRQQAKNYFDLLLVEETGRYVFRILAVKNIFENPKRYGFNIRKADLYSTFDCRTVVVDSTVASFADFAKQHNISYKILKHFNPWLRESYLKNTSHTSYEIKLPTNKDYDLN
tara:strand:+ start:1254 stop:2201 length:948 start_codon:yes stop_codon:yes gene_type:complete